MGLHPWRASALALLGAAALCVVPALAAQPQCCSTKAFDITKKGQILSFGCEADPGLSPLTRWFKGDGPGVVPSREVWRAPRHNNNYVWLAFAGDSELRLEFWMLARQFGEDTK
jgi:hypothetical protein